MKTLSIEKNETKHGINISKNRSTQIYYLEGIKNSILENNILKLISRLLKDLKNSNL